MRRLICGLPKIRDGLWTSALTRRWQREQVEYVVPIAGLLEGPSLLLSEGDAPSAEEPIYAGKPMSYWLAKANSGDYDRDLHDLGEQWVFRHFGDAAVPGLIKALGNNVAYFAETELEGSAARPLFGL